MVSHHPPQSTETTGASSANYDGKARSAQDNTVFGQRSICTATQNRSFDQPFHSQQTEEPKRRKLQGQQHHFVQKNISEAATMQRQQLASNNCIQHQNNCTKILATAPNKPHSIENTLGVKPKSKK
ncbi:hypothetical protein Nepgr_020442 [Nepenthes gracilis]|uniref:Uncharacterized protein n=1 Tax=Nepenthes gracilis TaxID=150966 RepID=A0AAD3XWD3_NEPGR|nr:hypothetical protein Nepgr_020442 [Nepenthes gracilis]